jgi:hypothetical protein
VTDSTALTRLNIDEMARVSKALSESNRFGSIQAQAVFVSVLAGQELGIPPFAAMTGIHVIQGKPILGAGILAGLVKASPKYDYRVTTHTNEACVIAFFEHGEKVGETEFTINDAKRAGLVKPGSPWVTYPKNMVFARALSNGVAFFCPDLTMSRVYVEGEVEESLPTPPPRDVVAVVEAEQAPPVRTPSAEPAAPTFPDDLADVQNAKTEKKKQTAIAKRDVVDAKQDAETEAMFGEAFEANKPSAAYSSDAAS